MIGAPTLLEVCDLTKTYAQRAGIFARRGAGHPAVQGVSFTIARGETLGLVGESGSGKSTIGRAILMLDPPSSGEVVFEGERLTELSRAELRSRRRRMQPVFQDPHASLSPRMTVSRFVSEPLVIHGAIEDHAERTAYVANLLHRVGLDESFLQRYPHQLSGGQQQRVCIARALTLKPSFIVADEPISALDVSIQAQVVNLLMDLQAELDLAFLMISHDLRIVRHICHRIAVLYRGRIVETGPTRALFDNPLHPYTRVLLAAIPQTDPKRERAREHALLDPDFDYGEPDSRLVEVSPGHWLAAARAQAHGKTLAGVPGKGQ
jgi:peptide/nickel transport system ATP-binding protein